VVELAACVARACLGDDHLWHDLGLPKREVLSDLLHEHFPLLARRNTHNMRWKKFFYLQLCEQVGVRACRAPSCGVCVNHGECFGSEELPLAKLAA
jgi:nitrogen fixation protein NifQ